MSEGGRKLDEERLSKVLDEMSDPDLERLEARSKSEPKSLTLDEVGILFLLTRRKIRAIEKKLRDKQERG